MIDTRAASHNYRRANLYSPELFLHDMYIKGPQAELGAHAPTAVDTRGFASRSCGCRAIGSLGPDFIKQIRLSG